MDNLIAMLYYAAPGLLLPLIIGVGMWLTYHTDPLGRIMALFVLKPLLATLLIAPLAWPVLAGGAWHLIMLPGALLTLLLVALGYRPLAANPRIARFILAGDLLRWALPYAIVALSASFPLTYGGSMLMFAPLPLLLLAWLWTSAYAVICMNIAARVIPPGPVARRRPWA